MIERNIDRLHGRRTKIDVTNAITIPSSTVTSKDIIMLKYDMSNYNIEDRK